MASHCASSSDVVWRMVRSRASLNLTEVCTADSAAALLCREKDSHCFRVVMLQSNKVMQTTGKTRVHLASYNMCRQLVDHSECFSACAVVSQPHTRQEEKVG